MAEERPRPGAEEDSDEAEEGEEAAEVPERPVMEIKAEDEGEEAALPEVKEEEAEAPLPPPPPPAEPQPPPPADPPIPRASLLPLPRASRPPLLGAFPQAMPEPSPAPPFLYSPPVVMYSPQPAAAASASTTSGGVNIFANDGSFMELFKKRMESGSKEEARPEEEDKKPEPERRKPISFVGKRRGGAKLALKTGMVAKKPKSEDEEVLSRKGGAWAQYMAEVKKYKAHQCSDDDKTRPLVK